MVHVVHNAFLLYGNFNSVQNITRILCEESWKLTIPDHNFIMYCSSSCESSSDEESSHDVDNDDVNIEVEEFSPISICENKFNIY